ncbi:hypothetical protein FBULB1_8285 [Fusarium bulbicola]|nr:hypothetical protein FBULB1_8285 [Fusarium bulbicola]
MTFPLSKADYTRFHDKIQVAFGCFDYKTRREMISFRIPPAPDHLTDTLASTDSINNILSSRIALSDVKTNGNNDQMRSSSMKKSGTWIALGAGLAQDPNELRRIPVITVRSLRCAASGVAMVRRATTVML